MGEGEEEGEEEAKMEMEGNSTMEEEEVVVVVVVRLRRQEHRHGVPMPEVTLRLQMQNFQLKPSMADWKQPILGTVEIAKGHQLCLPTMGGKMWASTETMGRKPLPEVDQAGIRGPGQRQSDLLALEVTQLNGYNVVPDLLSTFTFLELWNGEA